MTSSLDICIGNIEKLKSHDEDEVQAESQETKEETSQSTNLNNVKA